MPPSIPLPMTCSRQYDPSLAAILLAAAPQSALSSRIITALEDPRLIDSAGMANEHDRSDKPRERTDAERRARQCARLANLMRVLHLISGRGRWDAKGLAEELECSQRTVHRMLQTLSMAGVPWYFDERLRAYRIREGFKFSLAENAILGTKKQQKPKDHALHIREAAKQLLEDGEAFAETLQAFLSELRTALADEDF